MAGSGWRTSSFYDLLREREILVSVFHFSMGRGLGGRKQEKVKETFWLLQGSRSPSAQNTQHLTLECCVLSHNRANRHLNFIGYLENAN
jgi:hypothetical protein